MRFRYFLHRIPSSCTLRFSSYLWETVRFCYTLVQYRSAAAANQVFQAISQKSVILECNQGYTVLPAFTDIL